MATRWLFLRGLVRETRHWGEFPTRFSEALKERVPTGAPLLLDLPGMGTERDRPVPPTVSGFVDDLRTRLEGERAADTRFALFAVSLGGMVALDWLSRFPDDFERAVIVNTSAGDLSSPFERFHPRNYLSIARALLSSGAERERHILGFTANSPALDRDAIAAQHASYAMERPMRTPVFVGQLRAAMKSRTPERLLVPALFLASRADRLVDCTCSERIAAKLEAPLRLHDSAGHDLPLDDPEWVIGQVASWMSAGEIAA